MSAAQPIARLRLVRRVVPKDEVAGATLFDGDLDADLDAAFVAAFDDHDAGPMPCAEGSVTAFLDHAGDPHAEGATAGADAAGDDDDAPTIRDQPAPRPEPRRRWLAVVRTEVGPADD